MKYYYATNPDIIMGSNLFTMMSESMTKYIINKLGMEFGIWQQNLIYDYVHGCVTS